MLTRYESILAVPDVAADFGYRFYATPFQTGAQTTVPELAALTFRYHVPAECCQDGEPPDGTVIVRIVRTDLTRYVYSEYYHGMAEGDYTGYTETVLYRDAVLDHVYEEYLTEKQEEQERLRNGNPFGPAIPDEEIPF